MWHTCDLIIKKLDNYGVKGISNERLESYLTDQKQSASINGFNSSISTITGGVPQGSVLEPLIFLIYVSDLNLAIKYFHHKAHHFADDTDQLNINKSPKRLNKLLNIDLKNLTK